MMPTRVGRRIEGKTWWGFRASHRRSRAPFWRQKKGAPLSSRALLTERVREGVLSQQRGGLEAAEGDETGPAPDDPSLCPGSRWHSREGSRG